MAKFENRSSVRARHFIWASALLVLLAGCRGCGGPLAFEQLLGTWRPDVEAALAADKDFAEMDADRQKTERERLAQLRTILRVTYTEDHLIFTMLLSPDAAEKRKNQPKLSGGGRIKELVRDTIVKHQINEDKNLVLFLRGPKGDEREVHIRRIDDDHIEMVQPGSNAPSSFRFFERVK